MRIEVGHDVVVRVCVVKIVLTQVVVAAVRRWEFDHGTDVRDVAKNISLDYVIDDLSSVDSRERLMRSFSLSVLEGWTSAEEHSPREEILHSVDLETDRADATTCMLAQSPKVISHWPTTLAEPRNEIVDYTFGVFGGVLCCQVQQSDFMPSTLLHALF